MKGTRRAGVRHGSIFGQLMRSGAPCLAAHLEVGGRERGAPQQWGVRQHGARCAWQPAPAPGLHLDPVHLQQLLLIMRQAQRQRCSQRLAGDLSRLAIVPQQVVAEPL